MVSGYTNPRLDLLPAALGLTLTVASLACLLKNKKYIGIYTYNNEIEIEGGCPALIDKETFEKCAKQLERNRRAPARARALIEYQLQGKAFCGYCGTAMVGESGRGQQGGVYHYYACAARKKRHTCEKRNEKKEFLEWYLVEQTLQYVLAPARRDYIAERVVAEYEKEFNTSHVRTLEKRLGQIDRELDKIVEQLLRADERAKTLTAKLNERALMLEAQKNDTESELIKMRIAANIHFSKEEILAWLNSFCDGDPLEEDFRRRIIDTFINTVYLYDDKVVIYYNIKGSEQVSYIEMLDSTQLNDEDTCSDTRHNGTPEGIRTPDPRIRSPLLYPTELLAQNGAGDGNRTHVASLEGWSSAIELHPHVVF